MSPTRRSAVVVAVLLLAALAMWTSAQLAWLRIAHPGFTAATTGGQLHPELTALAALALAAVAAVIATTGWSRGVVGALLAIAGAWPAWRCATALASSGRPVGPALGLVAGLLMLLAGVLTLAWAGRMAGLGVRYAAPGAPGHRRERPGDWWRALDGGEDPTDPAPSTDPGRER